MFSVSSFLFLGFGSRSLFRLSFVRVPFLRSVCVCVRANIIIYAAVRLMCNFLLLLAIAILPDAFPATLTPIMTEFKVNSCKYLKLLEHIRALQANIFTLLHVRYNLHSNTPPCSARGSAFLCTSSSLCWRSAFEISGGYAMPLKCSFH